MFEVYKRIEWHYDPNCDDSPNNFNKKFERDDFLFNEIKSIITELVLVKPEMRMKLYRANERLKELESKSLFKNESQYFNDFLLLKERFRTCLYLTISNSMIGSRYIQFTNHNF